MRIIRFMYTSFLIVVDSDFVIENLSNNPTTSLGIRQIPGNVARSQFLRRVYQACKWKWQVNHKGFLVSN